MEKKLYKIRNWDKHFETSETKKYKSLKWVPVPNKHDGKGYRKIMRENPLYYAAWIVILQIASKCIKRGILEDEDGPLSIKDISIKTDFPEAVLKKALPYLSQEIHWLEETPEESAVKSSGADEITSLNRIELNGTEKKKKSPVLSPDAASLCDHLCVKILENDPQAKLPPHWLWGAGWGRDSRLLLEKDGRSYSEAIALITWATSHHFWKSNILSMGKFREKYTTLKLQRDGEKEKKQEIPQGRPLERFEPEDFTNAASPDKVREILSKSPLLRKPGKV